MSYPVYDDDRYYFAYGSNLSTTRKEKRTGGIRESIVVDLNDFRFAFNKLASSGDVYANIVPSKGCRVWGVAYRCEPAALSALDIHEGVATGHYLRKEYEVFSVQGTLLEAVAYVAGKNFVTAETAPPPWYLKLILKGAKEHKLPPDYIKRIVELGNAR